MTVRFNIVERGNPANQEAPEKFYPSIQSSGRVTSRELAKGNIVELGDFGSFWLKVTSEGAATADEVRADQINSVMPRFIPGKLFKDVLDKIKFNKN